MRRLAIIDALTAATFLVCLAALTTVVDAVGTPSALAGRKYYEYCAGPSICMRGSGSCVNCTPGGQLGNCSSWPHGVYCTSDRDYCSGNISGELTECNCSTSGCTP